MMAAGWRLSGRFERQACDWLCILSYLNSRISRDLGLKWASAAGKGGLLKFKI